MEPDEIRRDSSASAVSAPGASTELFESGPLKTMKLNRQMEEEEGMIEGDIGEQKHNVEDEAEEYEDDVSEFCIFFYFIQIEWGEYSLGL